MSIVDSYRKISIYRKIAGIITGPIIVLGLYFFLIKKLPLINELNEFPPVMWFIRFLLVFIIIFLIIIPIITTIFSVKKTKEIDLEEKPLIPPKTKRKQPKDEKVVSAIFSITKQVNTPIQTSNLIFLGVGEIKYPENSMIITNKRVILAVVPIPGQGKIINNVNISIWNWIFGRKYLIKKGKKMLKKMTPQQILEFDKHNYEIPLDQIKQVKIKKWFDRSVNIITKDGKKHKYVTLNKKDIIKLKEAFSEYLV